ncbi:hypothetical protein ACIQ2D_09730 [Lysinibacillus sp. NPDC097287]|uniref:hypothetical protein n=1 Tax=Lysinibacillus sp. NPDC097287 TaxID=3364144 RepID=UPI0038247C4D
MFGVDIVSFSILGIIGRGIAMKNKKDEMKLSEIFNKIGVNNPNEIIQYETFEKLVDNFSKLPKESLEDVLRNIPNFQELVKQYMENLNLSYNKIIDDLIEEKRKVEILNEIKSIRKTIILKDTIYNIQNNKILQIGAGVVVTIVGVVVTIAGVLLAKGKR